MRTLTKSGVTYTAEWEPHLEQLVIQVLKDERPAEDYYRISVPKALQVALDDAGQKRLAEAFCVAYHVHWLGKTGGGERYVPEEREAWAKGLREWSITRPWTDETMGYCLDELERLSAPSAQPEAILHCAGCTPYVSGRRKGAGHRRCGSSGCECYCNR